MFPVLSSLAIIVVGASTALHALLSKRDSRSALGWVAVCLLAPIAGPLIYIVFGINRVRTKVLEPDSDLHLLGKDSPESERVSSAFTPYSIIGDTLTGRAPVDFEEIEILENGDALFPSMLRAIDEASSKVHLSTYIFQFDEIGAVFVDALYRAQQRGVEVRIIIDGLGAMAYARRVYGKLKKHELNVKLFNPISIIPPSLHINMRNHRKLLVVDGVMAYTGGQNISERHLILKPSNSNPTQDIHFKFTGNIVSEFEYAFLRDWNQCNNKDPQAIVRENSEYKDLETKGARIILDGPNENLDRLNELLLGIFATATERIWIMTPYFLPGADLVGAIKSAELKGVDVKLFVPEYSNVYMAHWAAQHSLQFLIAKGLEVHTLPAPFVHAKAILVDDRYSVIGSANMDPRSLRLNYEIAVEVFSATFNKQLSGYFVRHLSNSTLQTCEKLNSRSKLIKIRDALAWLFSPYL